jgi:phage terminase Nu1 subunit (DNA packaging protein)
MASGDTIVRGTVQVALHFGVSRRTVQRWAQDPTFPKLPGRRFELVQIRMWLDQRDGRPSTPPARGPGPWQPELVESRGKNYQDERLKRAKADLAEMEVRRRRSELVEWSKVEEFNERKIMEVKQRLLFLPQSLPPRLVNLREREMVEIIHRAIHDVLVGFAQPAPASLMAGAVEMAQVAEQAFIGDLKETPGPGNQEIE